jgi:type II secretory pathway component PulC
MKLFLSTRLLRECISLGAILLCAAAVAAAPSKDKTTSKAAPAKGKADPAKAESAEQETPQSVFIIPTSFGEGRDPFFPNRPVVAVARPSTNRVPVSSVKLVLSGLSGTREKPLAIINNRTFETGEEGDIATTGGRTHVRCVEIKEDAVIVEVNGSRQELRFRKGVNN